MGKLVVYRERQLITNSKVINDYPQLLRFIKNTPEMDERELYTLENEMQLFFKNIYDKVKKQAILEWNIDISHPIDILEDKHKIRCQLCNHKIKNVCYIINRMNGKRLKVGTECVKHFGIDKSVSIQKLLEERMRIKRLEDLDKEFPGIESKIDQWLSIVDNQPIFIKNDIKYKYIKLGEKASQLLQYYCEKNLSIPEKRNISEKFHNIFIQRNKEINKIKAYVEKNKNNKLIPSKQIIDSLRRRNQLQALKWLEEDGMIKGRTMFRITDEKFIKSLIIDFNKYLIRFNCRIKGVGTNKGNMGYIIIYNKNKDIKLFCNYRDFCIQYCGLITNEEIYTPLNFNEILKISSIYGEQSIEYSIEILQSYLNNYGIIFDEVYYEYDDAILYDKIKNNGFFIKLSDLLQRYKYLIFKIDNMTQNLYQYILSQSKTRYSKQDIEYMKRRRKKDILH